MNADVTTAPRVRWAAVIWGALFALVSGAALWLLSDDDRRSTAGDAILDLTPATITAAAILTIGVLFLATGAAGLLRRTQSRSADASGTAPGSSAPDLAAPPAPE